MRNASYNTKWALGIGAALLLSAVTAGASMLADNRARIVALEVRQGIHGERYEELRNAIEKLDNKVDRLLRRSDEREPSGPRR